jgi:hypothetical protein
MSSLNGRAVFYGQANVLYPLGCSFFFLSGPLAWLDIESNAGGRKQTGGCSRSRELVGGIQLDFSRLRILFHYDTP